jgi:hypothetical protein
VTEQSRELGRVADRLRPAILAFAAERGASLWHAHDLHTYVLERVGAAPASADRVLRLLRQEGALSYVVVNRRQSLYRFESASATPPSDVGTPPPGQRRSAGATVRESEWSGSQLATSLGNGLSDVAATAPPSDRHQTGGGAISSPAWCGLFDAERWE